MGKGARNREKRKQEADADELVGRLLDLQDEEEFLAELAHHPKLVESEVEDRLAAIASSGVKGITFGLYLDLIREARDEPTVAWRRFRERLDASGAALEELEAACEEIDAQLEAAESGGVIARAEELLPRAHEAALVGIISRLELQRAHAFLGRREGDRVENIEYALEGFARALDAALHPNQAAHIGSQMAIAIAERLHGDPAENLEDSIRLLRDALSWLDDEAAEDLRTTIETNLASSLLKRERGDRRANLKEGIAFCERVLTYRSPRRDAREWAYIKLNQGPLLEQLALLDDKEPDAAEAVYREVIEVGERLPDWQLAAAHYSLGRLLRRETHRSPADLVERYEDEGTIAEDRETERRTAEVRQQACKHLEVARDLASEDRDPVRTGRIHAELAEVLYDLEELEAAIEPARKGLELMPPTRAPRDCVRVAGRLGDLLCRFEEFGEAATAFRAGVEASEIAFHGRLELGAREREARSNLNLARWASFAMAAAGDPVEAALVLESSRTRELRQRLGLDLAGGALIDALPSDLAQGYRNAIAALSGSPQGQAGARAARELHETLAAIRSVPGFEGFATVAESQDLVGAVEPDWPLLYVNPTPYGTMLLLIEGDGEQAVADTVLLEEPTSLQVFLRLMAGDAAGVDLDEVEFGSYLAGASGFGDNRERDIQNDVEHVLPWIGSSLCGPIAELLAMRGARGVTLVPCGPIGLAPLHAAPYELGGLTSSLVDECEVRYAPSGILAATCMDRAAQRAGREPRLIALADPDGSLEAAEPEVRALLPYFAADRSIWVAGEEASLEFLRGRAADATHVHLACHAGARVWNEGQTGIVLAEGMVDARELAGLELHARLVAVSACQSAVIDISHLPEEAFSVSSAMLSAGAACVIASLWPVRDDTTALLMSRVYEEIIVNGHRPPEALRHAQLWLRDLNDPELEDYLAERPSLRTEFGRRAKLGDRAGRRGPGDAGTGPFSAPDYWAPFIAVGV